MRKNTDAGLAAIAQSLPGKVTSRMIFRGYDIEIVDGGVHIILKNGQVVGQQPTKEAAWEFINPLADAVVLEAKRQREADEAARKQQVAAPAPTGPLATFKVMGSKRATAGVSVSMFVDAPVSAAGVRANEVAEALQPDYKFYASQDVFKPVPDAAKNKLFFSDEELYAAAPEHRPPGRHKKTTPFEPGGLAAPRARAVAAGTSYAVGHLSGLGFQPLQGRRQRPYDRRRQPASGPARGRRRP